MTAKTEGGTPRTDALFDAYDVDMDGVTLRDGVAALERENADLREQIAAELLRQVESGH